MDVTLNPKSAAVRINASHSGTLLKLLNYNIGDVVKAGGRSPKSCRTMVR